MSKEAKEVIEGYTVQASVNIGAKRIIFAKDETEKAEMPYMKCIAVPNMLFTRYENAVVSTSFEEIMKLFADDIKAEAIMIEAENRARRAEELPPFKAADLIPDQDKNLVGQVVAIDTKYLHDGYKSLTRQLYYVTGGHGTRPNARGSACFCYDLYTGENDRIERYEVLGIVPKEKIPDFALKTLEEIKHKEKAREGDAR